VTRRLLLVRHGVTTWNREGRFQGHLDPPLDPGGVSEARWLAQRLVIEERELLRLVSSPLRRASATARLLADGFRGTSRRHVELTEDARLMEIGQGEWEGRTHTELAASDPERYAAWRSGGGLSQPPGAEALQDAQHRVASALEELTEDAVTHLCLVSHGGILRLAARHLLGLPLERAWAMDVDNASLSRLSQADGDTWRLDAWNDTSHLLGRTPLHVDEAEGAPLSL
jgi:broad specificity phosphatase PhoE